MTNDALAEANEAYQGFTDQFQSMVLATVDTDGMPHASYTPYWMDEDRNLYCFVSGLSKHTGNMTATGKVSVFFVEDESAAKQIFARRRLNYECRAELLERHGEEGERAATAFEQRYGGIASTILSMPDFRPFRLTPESGSFVIGFGAAFHISGDNLGELTHLTGDGKGHGLGGGGHGHAHGAHGHDEAPGEPLSDEAVARILEHMNSDHADSVLNYARVYGKRDDAQEATLTGLDAEGMDIALHTKGGQQDTIRVPFETPLRHAGDAHKILVQMAIKARQAAASTGD
jgi:putative heme iron utilization protein